MPNAATTVVFFGAIDEARARIVRESARTVGLDMEVAATPSAMTKVLESIAPAAVIVPREADGAEEACAAVRSRLAWAPLLALTDDRSETAFLESYQRGCDDLVAVDPVALARRLKPIVNATPSRDRPRAAAVVASADASWRSVVGRGLRSAGVDSRFVGNASDAIELARDAKLIVSSEDLEPEGAVGAAMRAREAGVTAPWVIIAPPKRVGALRNAAARVFRCAVIDACAPPENAVFIANDLAGAGPNGLDQRAASRLLFGTTVSFRAAGRESDDIGFTYNVSPGGCYVRTLAPLSDGEIVWLEMFPPRCDRRVRLAGRVAWRRLVGPSDTARVPPGFGVEITEGLGADLARYRAGCESLARAMAHAGPARGRRSMIPSEIAPAIV